MAATQDHRSTRLTTPLGKDVLLFAELTAAERLSQPFEVELEILSENGAVDADRILGQPATVAADLPVAGQTRYFNGFVTEFSQVRFDDPYFRYRATLRPWFWFLTRSADCRIFQNLTVTEIFEKVVQPYGFKDYQFKLQATYPSRLYCVQYRETDFNFLSRLLEYEGIYYYFEHTATSHRMVLVDDPTAHGRIPGYESVPYGPPEDTRGAVVRDRLTAFLVSKSVQSGIFATTDYDFEKPKLALVGNSTISAAYSRPNLEVFDFPAELQTYASSESDRIAKIRIQELNALGVVARGSGNAAGLATGYVFTLARYPREQFNTDYLVIATQIRIAAEQYRSAAAPVEGEWTVSIEAIGAQTPFRPPRTARKPAIQGAQTATVVGPSGDEIWTDKYGRVKVQFPWDRYGKSNETSSCWMRVAQFWAGSQWGAIHTPRIGQEVLVSFLEGDPDQPIITGRVYNGDEMPPYTLPDNQTQSGIKSNSSKGGGGSNEFRFEDKKGAEEVYLHAQKDWNSKVEHDRTETVGNDETLTVTGNRKESVNGNETISIGKDRTETVSGGESITIGKDRSISVGGGDTESVSKDQSIQIGGSYTLMVSKSITLQNSAGASIVLSQSGDVTISGTSITLNAQAGVTIQAGTNLTLNGQTGATLGGLTVSVSGEAQVSVSGGMIMIG